MSDVPAAPKRDNLFGVCAAIGADFGFDPFVLRVALAIGVIAAPKIVLIGYACAAMLVIVSRLVTRDCKPGHAGAEVHALPLRDAAATLATEPLRRAA